MLSMVAQRGQAALSEYALTTSQKGAPMKCISTGRTAGFHRVGLRPLQLELLEDRLPPGNLMGSDLLVGTRLPSSVAVAPPQPPATVRPQLSGVTAGSSAPVGTSEDASLVVDVADGLAAGRDHGTPSSTAWLDHIGKLETSESLLEDPLSLGERERSQPRDVSRPAASPDGSGSSAQLADGGQQAGPLFFRAISPAAGGTVGSFGGSVEMQASTLPLAVPAALPSSDPEWGNSLAGENGLARSAELSVVATQPSSNGLAWPVDKPLVVEFSDPVNPITINRRTFAVFGRMSGMKPGAFRVGPDGLAVTYKPASPFMPGETVEVLLTHDIAAVNGQKLRTAGYTWTFWTQAVSGGGNAFVDESHLDTGNNVRTYGGQATDLNRDGTVDLAVVNEDSADMRVFMNNGDGTFGPMVIYPIGPGASPTVAGDFNRDGFTDIASSNTTGNSMSVLLGKGDGTFQASQNYTTGTFPKGIAAVDINGDGAVELVVVNSGSNTLSLFKNNGNGTFQPQTQFFNVPGAKLYGLAAADMNNDGIMDLVFGAQQTKRVYVLLGDGAGGFVQSMNQRAGGGPWVVKAADVDGDGYADVQIANSGQDALTILRGDGTGKLNRPVSYPAGNFPLSVSLGDLNGDGSLDAVVSNFSSDDYTIFTNTGTGLFTETGTLNAQDAGSCALIFDYNGDQRLDIGGVDELEDEIIMFRNAG